MFFAFTNQQSQWRYNRPDWVKNTGRVEPLIRAASRCPCDDARSSRALSRGNIAEKDAVEGELLPSVPVARTVSLGSFFQSTSLRLSGFFVRNRIESY